MRINSSPNVFGAVDGYLVGVLYLYAFVIITILDKIIGIGYGVIISFGMSFAKSSNCEDWGRWEPLGYTVLFSSGLG